MEKYVKGEHVSFTYRGATVTGTVVRHKKSDGMVTVDTGDTWVDCDPRVLTRT